MAQDSTRGEAAKELSRVMGRFEKWRRERRSRRERIPPELWQAAIAAAGRAGTSRTARTLRLNEQELRRRAQAGGSDEAVKLSGRTGRFVELRPAPPQSAASWVVELETASGARLRIEGNAESSLDVASLTTALLRVSS